MTDSFPNPSRLEESPRLVAMEAESRRAYLTTFPAHQAQTIAGHYLSAAGTAHHLAILVENRAGGMKGLDEVIASMTEEIKAAHLRDFGLALEWKP